MYKFFTNINNRKSFFALIYIGLASSVLLFGYEFSRSPSSMLFKEAYGTQSLPVIMAIIPIGVMLFIYLYTLILTCLGPKKTLFITSMLSAFLILGCYVFISLGFRLFTGILYVIREAYVVIIIEQYWSFINSTFKEHNAKIFNGPLLGLSAIGPIFGGLVLGTVVKRYGTLNMLLVCVAATIVATFISHLAYVVCGEPQSDQSSFNTFKSKNSRINVDYLELKLFYIHPQLIILFLIIIITQVVSTFLELSFQGVLQLELVNIDKQTAYSGILFSKINIIAALMQFVCAPLILKTIPIPLIHILIPFLHLVVCSMCFLNMSLDTISLAYILFKSLDYSLFRGAKEILYIPFSFEVRFKAKEIIDVFGYRLGKGLISLFITLLQTVGIKLIERIFILNTVFALVLWIGFIIAFFKTHNYQKRFHLS